MVKYHYCPVKNHRILIEIIGIGYILKTPKSLIFNLKNPNDVLPLFLLSTFQLHQQFFVFPSEA